MVTPVIDRVQRWLTLLAVIAVIGAGIYYLDGLRSHMVTTTGPTAVVRTTSDPTAQQKAQQYPPAQEFVAPSGYLNSDPFKIQDLIGKQVILVDFWTYSCINCQRTLPYLNAWYDKYHDQGLTIVGVHTPEFQFEHERSNVAAAITKFQIKYPVVQDNDYGTWTAYGNQYWPHKYLIDIDGNIVYDHIGEGGYDETEQKIQELLHERQTKLGQAGSIPTDVVHPVDAVVPNDGASPETYFGANRNELLANGQPGQINNQELTIPTTITPNQLYLGGKWQFTPEYAQAMSVGTTITYQYQAQDVYLVAAADQPVRVQIKRDGQPQGIITIQAHQLYTVIHDSTFGQHRLELTIQDPGLQVYTFTFG